MRADFSARDSTDVQHISPDNPSRFHVKRHGRRSDHAAVTHLTTHFGVEVRAIENDRDFLIVALQCATRHAELEPFRLGVFQV